MKRSRTLALAALLLLALATGWAVLTYWILPRKLFEKAVLNPIPPSVKEIKGSGFLQAKNCHTYVLRFKISAEDVPLILASDQFKEIEEVGYSSSGVLHYAERRLQSHVRMSRLPLRSS